MVEDPMRDAYSAAIDQAQSCWKETDGLYHMDGSDIATMLRAGIKAYLEAMARETGAHVD